MIAPKARLTLATRNAHKTREFAEMLESKFDLHDLKDVLHPAEVEETGSTFAENAALKALATSRAVPGYVLADDSGLEVDAIGGAPGIYSARYAGIGASDAQNVAKLLRELQPAFAGEQPTSARFHCVLVLALNGKHLVTAAGKVEGHIIPQPRGLTGFGYDPVFIPEGSTDTFAGLPPARKNQISHRAHAVAEFLRLWQNLTTQP